MLTSMNNVLDGNDIDAIADSHKYFDYNLNFRDRTQPKPMHVIKIH
jgi:hypothetical protein